jgi:CelD/BcsL family acetyltransferase involved in cellulose biosynthesis
MAIEALAFETVRTLDGFRALQPEWDDLWRRAKGEYFQSFAFCVSALLTDDIVARRKLHCITGRCDGRLVTIWPLVTFRNLCWKYATPLGPENRAPSDILAAPDHDRDELVGATWRAALRSTGADVFQLWRIRSTSSLHRYATRGNIARRLQEEPTPYAMLHKEQDWEAFCRSRPGRSRTRPLYLKKRLASHGAISVDMVEANDQRLQLLIDWFVLHKREWARHNDLNSQWVFSESSRAFWNALLSQGSPEAGEFHLFVLTLDGEPCAMNIIAVNAACAYLLANTYNLGNARLSPGTVLIDDCVKWAYDHGLDFDFGPGAQSYKFSWTGGLSYTTASFLALPTLWGRSGHAAKQGVKRLRLIAGRVAGKHSPAVCEGDALEK